MTMLSVVLPCYNEVATLRLLVESFHEQLPEGLDLELILVDNGSSDGSAELLETIAQEPHPFTLNVVTVNPNQGLGNGIMQGMQQAKGRFVAWSHADMQTPTADIFRLFTQLQGCADPTRCFGKGYRVNDRGNSAILTKLHSLFSRLILGQRMEEIYAQPKLFHRTFLERFQNWPLGYELDTYAYYKALQEGLQIVTVDVHFLERQAGESKWAVSFSSRLRFMIKNFFYLLQLRWQQLRGRL